MEILRRKSNVAIEIGDCISAKKMAELQKLLQAYKSEVMQFAGETSEQEFWDEVAACEHDGPISLDRISKKVTASFFTEGEGWSVASTNYAQVNRKNASISLLYYKDVKGEKEDQVIGLECRVDRKRLLRFKTLPGDIDLRVSLKTGMAWKTCLENLAITAENEQITIICFYLKKAIKKLRYMNKSQK